MFPGDDKKLHSKGNIHSAVLSAFLWRYCVELFAAHVIKLTKVVSEFVCVFCILSYSSQSHHTLDLFIPGIYIRFTSGQLSVHQFTVVFR